MLDPHDEYSPYKKRASLLPFILIIIGITTFCLMHQYDAIKSTIKLRLSSISSDHVLRKEEIKEITNQAITEIENSKQNSLTDIDNHAKELEHSGSDVVVPDDVLRAVNKVRRETR